MGQSNQRHGIPEEVIDLFGPPAVLPHRVEQFYQLLQALEKEHRPRGTADWYNLWDMAIARIEFKQIGAAKVVAIALHHDRAALEILRADSLRYVGLDPSAAMGRDLAIEDGRVVDREPKMDMTATMAALDRLELPKDAVWDVAYLLAAPILAPLEALSVVKLNIERAARQDIERRHERLDQRQTRPDDPSIADAEFTPVLKSERGLTKGAPDRGLPLDVNKPGAPPTELGVADNIKADLQSSRTVTLGVNENGNVA